MGERLQLRTEPVVLVRAKLPEGDGSETRPYRRTCHFGYDNEVVVCRTSVFLGHGRGDYDRYGIAKVVATYLHGKTRRGHYYV